MTVTSRGTSNRNKNGSAAGRRARKRWLIQTYRADVDVIILDRNGDPEQEMLLERHLSDLIRELPDGQVRYVHELRNSSQDPEVWVVPRGLGEAACRCYRCGRLLWFCTVEVDRIHPGWKKTAKWPNGGTYVRENIRPACGGPKGCNIITGNEDRWGNHKPFRLLAELLDLIRGDQESVDRVKGQTS